MSPAPSTTRPPSVWEDLLEVVYAPRAVFTRRVPYQAFGAAMVILTIASAAIFFATRQSLEPIFDATVTQQIAEIHRQNPQLKEEQLQGIQGWIKFGISATILAAPILFPLIGGLLLWGTGKFFDSKAELGGMMMVSTYSYVPRLLGFVASSVLAVVLPEDQIGTFFSISFSAAHFAPPGTTQAMLAVLARADLFLFWQMALMAVGVAVLGKVSMGKAVAVAFIVWALGMVPAVPGLLR